MKRTKLAVSLAVWGSVMAHAAFAADLKDVKVIQVKPGPDKVELKLRRGDGPKESYFFVDITKEDPDAFGKLAAVMGKIINKNSFKLNLAIENFSGSPSGSRYRSSYVKFFETK